MLLTNANTQDTSAAIADTTKLTAFRGDRLSVMPEGLLNAAEAPHGDCEYSGIVPGVWFTGVSRPICYHHLTDFKILNFTTAASSSIQCRPENRDRWR